MKKCCICGCEIHDENAPVLFLPKKTETPTQMCDECARQVEVLSGDGSEMQRTKAKGYLYARLDDIKISEIQEYINALLQDRIIKDVISNETVSNNQYNEPNSYNFRTTQISESFWISGSKIVAWVLFFAIIIAGFVLGITVGQYSDNAFITGFIISLLSIVVAFLSVAGLMIYLNMASDISKIRQLLEEKHK